MRESVTAVRTGNGSQSPTKNKHSVNNQSPVVNEAKPMSDYMDEKFQ